MSKRSYRYVVEVISVEQKGGSEYYRLLVKEAIQDMVDLGWTYRGFGGTRLEAHGHVSLFIFQRKDIVV